ncbi:MerR family transcriptional regulator [Candidatus Latescibacterota bacterium]
MRQTLGTKLYYSIGEVAEITDLQPYTLRAWEKEFPCLRPRRVRGKNRAYRQRDIGVILLIKRLLYDERYSTRGVQRKLKNEPELVRGAVEGIDARADGATATAAPVLASTPGEPAAEASESGPGETEERPRGDLHSLVREVRRDLREILDLLS